MARTSHPVIALLGVLGLMGAGCGRSGAQCPDANYLEPVYWSGDSAPCSQAGQICPVSYREVCLSVSGTAECFDYASIGGRGTGWIFHMSGENRCCPKIEPDAGTPCQQPPDAGAHLCRYTNDGGPSPFGRSYLCVAGAWCSPSTCP